MNILPTAKRITVLLTFSCFALPGVAMAESAAAVPSKALTNAQPQVESTQDRPAVAPMVDRAVRFLQASQSEEGAFSGHLGPAVTALVTTGLMEHGRTPADPLVRKGLDYVLGFVKEDGSICSPSSMYRNYETCVAIQCFKRASQFPSSGEKYAAPLAKAEEFVKGLQWDSEEGYDASSTSFGGAGYGKHRRPDLSNTSFLVDALHSLGRGEEDPAMQRALAFVSRTQNLETEHNTTPHASLIGDGGFYYTPAAGGESQAGKTDNGGLRSYGSMTYAGLKSMIYAGVSADDPRVKAASAWIAQNYHLDSNPGMGTSGLYYYYQTFAKALAATGTSEITDPDGVLHNWRVDLAEQLGKLQKENGSWTNENERWLESDPNLSTAYCLLALSHCK